MPIIQLTTLKVKFDDSPQLEFLTFVSKINLSVWGLFLFVFLFVFCFFQGEKIVWTDHITIYCIDKATETGPNWNVKNLYPHQDTSKFILNHSVIVYVRYLK